MRRILLAAAQLVDDLDGQRRREESQFADGYRLGFGDGFNSGYDVGYGRATEEMSAAWSRVAQAVRRAGERPTHDELAGRRRAAPGPAWRHYQGGPVEWGAQERPPAEASA